MTERRPNMAYTKTEEKTLCPEQRRSCFDEVSCGYTPEQAMAEAERCLNCPDRYCAAHCPAHNYIPEFIAEVRKGDFKAAWELLARTNPLMEISGRVCPFEQQCESECTRGIRSEPVAIGKLERFVADWYRENGEVSDRPEKPNGHSVAIVGSGPAGFGCAAALIRSGFAVTVYEQESTLGGVPSWGIPGFVLPEQKLPTLIDTLKQLGVRFVTNTRLGRDVTMAALREKYDAVFLAVGAGKPAELPAEGRGLSGIVQAADYLKAPVAARKVAVIGGGNTAIDAARVAVRMGAESVTLVYRRPAQAMPATKQELALAEEEGVSVLELASPLRFLGEDGQLTQIECARMVPAAADYPGGRPNSADSGERFVLDADLAVLALGFGTEAVEGVACDESGRILVNDRFETSVAGVYAGGDAVRGASTLMKAMADGKGAAAMIFDSFNA